MSAFDRLERQLLESVGERARSRRRAGLPLFRRKGAGHRLLVPASSLLAAALAVTVWAGPARQAGPAPEISAGVLERACVPCQAFGGRLHSGPQPASNSAREGASGQQSVDRRGLSVVRWSQQVLTVAPGDGPPSAG